MNGQGNLCSRRHLAVCPWPKLSCHQPQGTSHSFHLQEPTGCKEEPVAAVQQGTIRKRRHVKPVLPPDAEKVHEHTLFMRKGGVRTADLQRSGVDRRSA